MQNCYAEPAYPLSDYPALEDALELAQQVEAAVAPLTATRALPQFAFGTLVRTRRVAGALKRLGGEYGFEGRVLVRSLLELYFNYEWVHLKHTERRANRFLRFHPLEKLIVMADFPPESCGADYLQKVKRLRRDRAKVRYLFRRKGKQGKLYWERSWAEVNSIEVRMMQVQSVHLGQAQAADRFMYMLFRWFSGVAHGSPQSFAEVLKRTAGGVCARTSEELYTDTSLSAATIALLVVLKRAARDLGVSPELIDRIDGTWESYKSGVLATDGHFV